MTVPAGCPREVNFCDGACARRGKSHYAEARVRLMMCDAARCSVVVGPSCGTCCSQTTDRLHGLTCCGVQVETDQHGEEFCGWRSVVVSRALLLHGEQVRSSTTSPTARGCLP